MVLLYLVLWLSAATFYMLNPNARTILGTMVTNLVVNAGLQVCNTKMTTLKSSLVVAPSKNDPDFTCNSYAAQRRPNLFLLLWT